MTKQWHANFDERQQRLIQNCRDYAGGDPAGLPGHEILKIVAKFAFMMDTMEGLIADVANAPHSDAMMEKIIAAEKTLAQRWCETKRMQL